jgi:hypothetical protein
MANPLERLRSLLGGTQKAAKSKAPYAQVVRSILTPNNAGQRRGAKMLRNFAENNEWVRIAINRRKRQIAQAKWRLVRTDDPKAAPDKRVEQQVRALFTFVNPKRESFRSLMDQVIEDILVLDAGCIEKEKTYGGQLTALYAVDGSTIIPNPNWDGTKPNAERYTQYLQFQQVAQFTNDELTYIMANPTTYRPIGLSPVETLVRVIEAEIYGEQYDYDMLKQTAPEGLLDLGRGVSPEEVESFREYYETEIAGTKGLAIFGGGQEAGVGGAVTFNPFKYTNREQQRMEYKKWLATKIAGVFEMDLLAFNLSEGVNRANGQNMTAQTDAGHVGLATLIAEFVTREIIWEIDPTGAHAFEFENLLPKDELSDATTDKVLMSIGALTPNEARTKRGEEQYAGSEGDATHWANLPYPFNMDTGSPQTSPDGSEPPENPNEPADPEDDNEKPKGSAKSVGPFVTRRAPNIARQTPSVRLRYLNPFTD